LIITASRRKYANDNIKRQIDVVETDIESLNLKFLKMQKAIKKNYILLRELLPMHFDEGFEQMLDLIAIIEETGGYRAIVNDIAELKCRVEEMSKDRNLLNQQKSRHAGEAICYEPDGGLPPKLLHLIHLDVHAMMEASNDAHAKELALAEQRIRDAALKEEDIVRIQHDVMLNIMSDLNISKAEREEGGVRENDAEEETRRKLSALIHAISTDVFHEMNKNGNGGGGNVQHLQEKLQSDLQDLVDRKILKLKELIKVQMNRLGDDTDQRFNTIEADFSRLNDSLKATAELAASTSSDAAKLSNGISPAQMKSLATKEELLTVNKRHSDALGGMAALVSTIARRVDGFAAMDKVSATISY
jgi:hypothetical protein